MRHLITEFRSHGPASRMLMANQFAINVGFYMLMPYLASYLSGPLALGGATIGLILGMRNFSQQGMFFLGGTLADRFGYKPLIVAGCLLRTAGFGLLAIVHSLPALLVASAATGFAGALFNPAVRAYLAVDAGDRRVEAFALFNVFYQAGILAGPLLGIALTTVDFRLTCTAAAAVFTGLTVLQLRALPAHTPDQPRSDRPRIAHGWRTILTNRRFVLFALTMTGSYVLSFQVYLALPLHAQQVTGSPAAATALITATFVISGAIAVAGQLKITAWFRDRWTPGRCLVLGMALLATSFVPLVLAPDSHGPGGAVTAGAAMLLCAAIMTLGTVVLFPFEMDTITRLSGGRLVATHYGFYNTIVGIGILAGNLFTGSLFDLAHAVDQPAIPWITLALIGAFSVAGLHALDRTRRLDPARTTAQRISEY